MNINLLLLITYVIIYMYIWDIFWFNFYAEVDKNIKVNILYYLS